MIACFEPQDVRQPRLDPERLKKRKRLFYDRSAAVVQILHAERPLTIAHHEHWGITALLCVVCHRQRAAKHSKRGLILGLLRVFFCISQVRDSRIARTLRAMIKCLYLLRYLRR